MKYMLLIYADEQAWTESERQNCYGESTQLAHDLSRRDSFFRRLHYSPYRRRPASRCAATNVSSPTVLSRKRANSLVAFSWSKPEISMR
jgi:hypothetical protein